MTAEKYSRLLRRTKRYYEEEARFGNVTYVSHPAEACGFRRDLVESIGLDFLPHDGPVELRLAMMNRIPKRLASFFSAAITSCWRIFGDDVPIDIIEPSVTIWEKNRDRIASAYEHLRQRVIEPHRLINFCDIDAGH
jgi:hypothetical protein